MIEIIRASVRPTLTIGGFGSWVYMIIAGKDYPEMFQVVVIGMLGWWFGEKLLSHAGNAAFKNIKINSVH